MPSTDEQPRPGQTFSALERLTVRHAATEDLRARSRSGATLEPRDAVRLVEVLGGGTATYAAGEEPVGQADLADALALLPHVRAELDETELGLITMARGRGLTWSRVAAALGLGSAQAAQQRHERLAARLDDQPRS